MVGACAGSQFATMSKKRIAISIALLLCLLSLVIWLNRSRSRDQVAPTSAPPEVSAPNSAGSGGKDLAESENGQQRSSLETPAVNAPGPTHVAGTIQFIDDGGQRSSSKRGFIEWKVFKGEAGPEELITAIIDNRWELDCAPDWIFEPVKAVWSSDTLTQIARIDSDTIQCTQISGHVLTAFLSFGFVLNVVDKLTRQHLDGVQIIFAQSDTKQFRELRCAPLEILDRMSPPRTSPILLPERPGVRAGWVVAPGCAWARFAYRGSEGEVTVALATGTSADVEVSYEQPPIRPQHLLVYALGREGEEQSLDERPPILTCVLPPSGRIHLDYLPIGSTRFVVSSGPNVPYYGPFEGLADAHLLAGTTTNVHIRISDTNVGPNLGSVAIALTSTIAPSKGSQIVLEPFGKVRALALRSPLTQDVQSAERYRGQFSNLAPGLYYVALEPACIGQSIEVKPGQQSLVEFSLTKLCSVDLMVYREGDNVPLRGADVEYRAVGSSSTWAWIPVMPNMDTHVYSFQCAPGTITLRSSFSRYSVNIQDVEVPTRDRQLVITLRKGHKIPIEVRSTQNGHPVLLPSEFWRSVDVQSEDQNGGQVVETIVNSTQLVSLAALDASETRYFVDASGGYVFTFPSWPGIRPIPSQRVQVTEAGPHLLTLDVEFE